MSSVSQQRVETYLADGAISKGQPVKIGSDGSHVAKANAASDKVIGLANNDVTTAEDQIEVALPGGGGWALVGSGGCVAGDMLTADSSSNNVVASSGNRTSAMAKADAASGDLVSAEVVVGVL